jgi:ATP-dependent DNA helicase UvrD/PcrA
MHGAGMARSDGVFHADLHVHSRFSRACSKSCDIPSLAWWAARKGVRVVGTGDFTHPAWSAELSESLVPAEPGLLRLADGLPARLRRSLPPSCEPEIRFLLSAEISTIYKYGDVTRKIHHLVYAPTFSAARSITDALSKVGNLASDGRPILGLDSRHLLDITLNAGPGCYLIPAHIWTPWFAVLGSKSGFDTVAECYRDLAEHVFAVETGLSSDPPMNWMCSSLDRYRLVSNSDAHSPPMLGREATTFSTPLDYFAMAEALRTGEGLTGTLNFFPEGGRYHLDGHRKCGVRFDPSEAETNDKMCPACGKPLTIGVLHRVAELADRPAGHRPKVAASATNLVSLPEIVAEIYVTGPKSKKVTIEVDRLVAALGPELHVLCNADLADVSRAGGNLLGEAIARLRRGEVSKEAGYDGEYGVIRLFRPGELGGPTALFDVPAPAGPPAREMDPAPRPPGLFQAGSRMGQPPDRLVDGPSPAAVEQEEGEPLLAGLDPGQRAAAQAPGPLMIIAGPGTGKTATLTRRIAVQLAARGLPPAACLALTFTRRAAAQLSERLATLIAGRPGAAVTTFHGLGLTILREHGALAGLADFEVADEPARLAVATELAGSPSRAGRMLAAVASDPAERATFAAALAGRGLVDFDGLVERAAALLRENPAVAASLRERWPLVGVDEYQDIDAAQYALLRLLAGDGSGLTVIGDPDQSIYGFRGGDVRFFLRFGTDYPGATTAPLTRNYRSTPAILTSALQAVAPATLVPGRTLRAAAGVRGPAKVTAHESADDRAEAAWIAATIDRLLGGASLHSLDTGRADGHAVARLGLADIAVLYRTDAQAGVLGQALTRAGLPFQKRSHDLLTRRAAVPEIIHQMRLAAPGPGAAGTAAQGSVPGAAGRNAAEAASGNAVPAGPAVADLLAAAVRKLSGAAGGPGPEVDVLAAGEVLAPLARRCGSDLGQFLTEISVGAEVDALDPRADAVTLLTLHAAKGLEYRAVFLAGCERDLLPLWLPGRDGGPDLAEERRLLFVGMTRARTHLYLTWAAHRRRRGATGDTGPSPFLASIDPVLLERPRPAAPRQPPPRQLRLL